MSTALQGPTAVAREGKPFWATFSEWAKTSKDFPKTFNYGTQWAAKIAELPASVMKFGAFGGNVKDFMSMSETPTKLSKFSVAVLDPNNGMYYAPSLASGREVVAAGTELINSLCDGVKLSHQFVPIASMTAVSAVNWGSTFLGNTNSAVQEIQNINNMQAIDEAKFVSHMLKVGRAVSYVAAAIIGLYSIAAGVVPPVGLLASLTAALVFSTVGFFHDKMRGVPEHAPPRLLTAAV